MSKKDTISQQQIAEWKAEFGKVFKSTVGDDVLIWRRLKRKEYVTVMDDNFGGKDLTEFAQIYARQEAIIKMVTLWPENVQELVEGTAGLATTLSDEIVLRSGFQAPVIEEL